MSKAAKKSLNHKLSKITILSKFELSLFDFIYSIFFRIRKIMSGRHFQKYINQLKNQSLKKTREKLKNHKRSKKFKKEN